MKFQTPYQKNKSKLEIPTGKSKVEKAGFIPAKRQIEGLINAGQRLALSRLEQFDFEGDKIDENYIDPTREPGFDLADASKIALEVEARLLQTKEAKAKEIASINFAKSEQTRKELEELRNFKANNIKPE